MIARVTASPQFPIPPLPANPHRGVKENFKLKQGRVLGLSTGSVDYGYPYVCSRTPLWSGRFVVRSCFRIKTPHAHTCTYQTPPQKNNSRPRRRPPPNHGEVPGGGGAGRQRLVAPRGARGPQRDVRAGTTTETPARADGAGNGIYSPHHHHTCRVRPSPSLPFPFSLSTHRPNQTDQPTTPDAHHHPHHIQPPHTSQAAYREALEEAGIGIKLEGILRVEHKLTAPTKGRLRVVYYGVPIHSDAPLKVVRERLGWMGGWVLGCRDMV